MTRQNPVGDAIDRMFALLNSVGFGTGAIVAVGATVLIVLLTQLQERAA